MNSPECKTSVSYSSSKNYIEKYYRTFPEITILFSSSHGSTKGEIFDNNANNSQHEKKEYLSVKKNELLKKFQNFLENLHLEEDETEDEKEVTKNLSFLLDLEPEEMGKKLKMIRNKTLKDSSDEKSKVEKSCNLDFTLTQFSKEEFDAENLRKTYENLLIENSELDLELIDANMKIREKNNEMIKFKILKQKNIHDFNQTRNNIMNEKTKNREKLNSLLEELKTKENYVKETMNTLSDLMLKKDKENESKESIINNQNILKELNMLQEKYLEIREKNIKLEKTLKLSNGKKIDFEKSIFELNNELELKKRKTNELTQENQALEIEIETRKLSNQDQIQLLTEKIVKINLSLSEVKEDNSIKEIDEQMNDLKLKKENLQRLLNEKRENNFRLELEFNNAKIYKENLIEELKKEIKKLKINDTKEEEELLQKLKDLSLLNEEKSLHILELTEANKKFFDYLNNQKKEWTLNLKKEEDKIEILTKNKIELIESKMRVEKENKILEEKEKEESERRKLNLSEQKNSLKNKIISIKQNRTKIVEEINDYQNKLPSLKEELEKNLKEKNAVSEKCEKINIKISNLKNEIINCSKNNEEICEKFKTLIDVNTAKEKELKEANDTLLKLKELTSNQIEEINMFNERINVLLMEISILEKGDKKEWMNYLKKKEKEKNQKKKKSFFHF